MIEFPLNHLFFQGVGDDLHPPFGPERPETALDRLVLIGESYAGQGGETRRGRRRPSFRIADLLGVEQRDDVAAFQWERREEPGRGLGMRFGILLSPRARDDDEAE